MGESLAGAGSRTKTKILRGVWPCEEEQGTKKRKVGNIMMRKLSVFLAALLLATPAMAAVHIIVESTDSTAAIKYATDGERVRAFALDITVNKGKIVGISDFIRGESTAEKPGYGIFPGNFGRYITVDAYDRRSRQLGSERLYPRRRSLRSRRSRRPGHQRHHHRDGRPVLSDRRRLRRAPRPPAASCSS